MNQIQILRTRLEQFKGQRNQIERSITNLKTQNVELERDIRRHEQAHEIIREVGIKTQEQLQYHISDITSLALEAVFDDPYELIAEFVQRRNKTECDLYFQREGEHMDPISASGGGAVDVAAFALRIAAWTMQTPKRRNTIILDEPLRFLSRDLQGRASQMIKELNEKLKLQFIIITHEETLTEYADKTFQVNLKKGISHVSE
jgi:DNA repair exonuclease SbcCD ATPase subunit